jgi:hypothetical protein
MANVAVLSDSAMARSRSADRQATLASGEVLPTQTRKRWGTMRTALGLPEDTDAKIIRRTMATWLNAAGVPEFEVKTMLGHTAGGATDHYIQVRPDHLVAARTTLDSLWLRIMFSVRSWRTNHRRTTNQFGKIIVTDQIPAISHNIKHLAAWWALRVSNPRPSRCKRDALPLS